MKKFLAEFREFAMRGNVLDLAVGVVIGSAFGAITTSLVNDIIMPLIGLLIGGIDLSKFNITLKAAEMNGEEVIKEAVTLGLGNFLAVILDFIIIAFAIFLMIRAINNFRKSTEKLEKKLGKKGTEEAPAEEVPTPPTSEELLTEIRDLLKNKK